MEGYAVTMKKLAEDTEASRHQAIWSQFTTRIKRDIEFPSYTWPWSIPHFILTEQQPVLLKFLQRAGYQPHHMRWKKETVTEREGTMEGVTVQVDILMQTPPS
jgi:hypothetical protein